MGELGCEGSNGHMREHWQDIEGFEKIYQVSNLGNVRSLDRLLRNGRNLKGRVLKKTPDKDGYLTITFSVNGKHACPKVHRLVAIAFIPNHESKSEVNHKDGDKTNNKVSNLEWVTRLENITHAYENGLKPLTTPKQQKAAANTAKMRRKPVVGTNVQTGVQVFFSSTHDAGRNGFHQGHIASCARGDYRYKTHRGYAWEYLNDPTEKISSEATNG